VLELVASLLAPGVEFRLDGEDQRAGEQVEPRPGRHEQIIA
jgi:hypothetical protein